MEFLISGLNSSIYTRLEEIMDIFYDIVNRFLKREKYKFKDLFNKDKNNIFRSLTGANVSINDSVLDKPYSKQMSFIRACLETT
jgi:hypothetical protein